MQMQANPAIPRRFPSVPEAAASSGAWIYFDGDCPICAGTVRVFRKALESRGYVLARLQEPWVQERLNLPPGEILREMRLATADGGVIGGATAVVQIAREFWWGRPLYWLAKIGWVTRLFESGYRILARWRYCAGGACSVRRTRGRNAHAIAHWICLVAAALLPALALGANYYFGNLPRWGVMWILAGALWFGLKLAMLAQSLERGTTWGASQAFGYLFGYPNVDVSPVQFRAATAVKVEPGEWRSLILNGASGAGLLGFAALSRDRIPPIATGWLAMVGIVLLLHFGIFRWLEFLWRMRGFHATALMSAPWRSTSLGEFWGRRWNTAFSMASRQLILTPLARRLGAGRALFVVFLISGLAHECVISIPASGGCGLPTAYFLIQFTGIVFERSRVGRMCGAGGRFSGWLWTMAIVVGPVYWLFSPRFIAEVILPFLQAAL